MSNRAPCIIALLSLVYSGVFIHRVAIRVKCGFDCLCCACIIAMVVKTGFFYSVIR